MSSSTSLRLSVPPTRWHWSVGSNGTSAFTTCCCVSCLVVGAVARTCWRSALTPSAMATATFLFSGGATIASVLSVRP
eukprot:3792323-Prymnesium_polylepis.1